MLNTRLEIFYEKVICEDFLVLYNFTNIALLPKFSQAVLSSTSNNFGSSENSVAQSFCAWQLITSQKSTITRARKSIAFFNVRKEMILGLKTTLRKKALFCFLDKALIFVLPKSISERHHSEKSSVLSKYNNQEKQNYLLSKPFLSEKNEGRVEFFTKNGFFKQLKNNESGSTFLTLPRFLRKNKLSQDNDFYLYQKIKKVTFLDKISSNWNKQNNKNFLNTFCLYEDFSEKSHSSESNNFGLKNNKKKYAFLLKKLSTKSSGNSPSKSFFTISNKSGSFFPEMTSLPSFFDSLSGFSLTFSLKKLKSLKVFGSTREHLIEKQFFSAFGCPR